MSDFDNQLVVTAKELHDLATEWTKLDGDLKNAILHNQLRQVDLVIDAWVDRLGIEKTWGDSLHPADVLDKLIFPQVVDRLDCLN